MKSPRIAGIGVVTPLGRRLASVLQAVTAGEKPQLAPLTNPFSAREFPVAQINPDDTADVVRWPRLRRSGSISHFACAAAADALEDAGGTDLPGRIGLVFATTNGGVVHTRKFFGDVSISGTHGGSPLLFPETVYNAPASHIAAALGITGCVTTLVNDSTAGLDALLTANEFLAAGACDRCLVVAAEEADWVVCEACASWNLADSCATPFGEGAAALLLDREEGPGPRLVEGCSPELFRSISEARARFDKLDTRGVDLVVSSEGGRRFDEAEIALAPHAARLLPKRSLGEAFAATALLQVALAAAATKPGQRALVATTGFHGQQAAIFVEGGA